MSAVVRRVQDFGDSTALIRGGVLSTSQVDALLRTPYDDPGNGAPVVHALGSATVRQRQLSRVVRGPVAILNDDFLDPNVRAHAPEGIATQLPAKRSALRREVITALRRNLKDKSPDVRFWIAFALGGLGARQARRDLRALPSDATVVNGWWAVGEEASDALDLIEGRETPERVSVRD